VRKLYHGVLISCLCIIAFAMLTAMYMLMDGVDFNVPMTVKNNATLQTTKLLYRPGAEIEATISYCKNRNIAGIIDWQLVDTYVRFYPASHADLPVGCHSYIMDLGVVPSDVSSESYHFTGVLTYKINSLTTVSYPLTTNEFQVETE
jgi:hypothetical protein